MVADFRNTDIAAILVQDNMWTLGYDFKVFTRAIEAMGNGPGSDVKEKVMEKWYEIHRECAWYDSHKSSKNVYYGYWSFEAGAIAKILNLDDSSLKDVPYYPYDLVRYKK